MADGLTGQGPSNRPEGAFLVQTHYLRPSALPRDRPAEATVLPPASHRIKLHPHAQKLSARSNNAAIGVSRSQLEPTRQPPSQARWAKKKEKKDKKKGKRETSKIRRLALQRYLPCFGLAWLGVLFYRGSDVRFPFKTLVLVLLRPGPAREDWEPSLRPFLCSLFVFPLSLFTLCVCASIARTRRALKRLTMNHVGSQRRVIEIRVDSLATRFSLPHRLGQAIVGMFGGPASCTSTSLLCVCVCKEAELFMDRRSKRPTPGCAQRPPCFSRC